MLMREAAGFSSGQRFHHSYRLRFPTDSTATRTLSLFSVSLFLPFSMLFVHSQKSRSDFSNYYFVSKALDPERLDLHGSTKRTFNWLLAERCFNSCRDYRKFLQQGLRRFYIPGYRNNCGLDKFDNHRKRYYYSVKRYLLFNELIFWK